MKISRSHLHHSAIGMAAAALALLAMSNQSAHAAGGFQVINLVSNTPGVAAVTDPNLVNPWGISDSPSGPFWVSDNNTALSTLYTGSGSIIPLVVTIPELNSASGPTGQVFNGAASNFGGNNFLFASEDGTISGWNHADGSNAMRLITTPNASYTGITISGADLYAANNNSGNIDVFSSSFAKIGSFTDPNSNGSTPFDIGNVNGAMYVTYAGTGGNFVDSFNPTTDSFSRLITGGPLDSPWGLTMAPSGFGNFGGDLLVGNFGNGQINAFNSNSGQFVGALTDSSGTKLTMPGLWGLTFGNGGAAGSANSLYFTAGGSSETSGVLGRITPSPAPEVPEPGVLTLVGMGLGGLLLNARRRRARS